MIDKKLIKGFYRRVLNEYKFIENVNGKDDSEYSDDYSDIYE